MKVALLLTAPLALLALVRDATTTRDMDVGLIALGGVVILGAYNAARRIYHWGMTHGSLEMACSIGLLALLALSIIMGGLVALQGVHAGR